MAQVVFGAFLPAGALLCRVLHGISAFLDGSQQHPFLLHRGTHRHPAHESRLRILLGDTGGGAIDEYREDCRKPVHPGVFVEESEEAEHGAFCIHPHQPFPARI